MEFEVADRPGLGLEHPEIQILDAFRDKDIKNDVELTGAPIATSRGGCQDDVRLTCLVSTFLI
jgi:hypothetical protein